VFDAVMVLTSVLDALLGNQVNLSGARVIRVQQVFRMVRILRVVRVLEVCGELRQILGSEVASLKSTFWAFLLLVTLIYLFAIWFMQVAINTIEQDGAQQEVFKKDWGSVDSHVHTAGMCIRWTGLGPNCGDI